MTRFNRLSIASLLTLGALPVVAQTTTLAPITVSADLRQSTDQNLAASTSIKTQSELQDQGATHFGDILLQTPNVNYSGQSSRPRHIQIRGMGERDEYTGAPNASVGFAIDGIDFSGIGMVGNLFDVKQVEVLRGPQSTRYGASALAGLINIQTNDPTADNEHMIEVSAGGDSLRELGLVSSGAFNKQANSPQYRFSVFKHTSDGFRNNAFLGRSDTNGRDELNIRGKLRFFPSSVTTVDVSLLHADYNNGYDAFSLNNSFTTLSDQPGKDRQLSNAGTVKVTHTGNPNFTLVSTTTLANSDMRYSYDQDWLYASYPNVYSAVYENQKHRRTISQEVRLTSTTQSKLFNQTTDWLAGAYVSKLDEQNNNFDTYIGTPTATDYSLTRLATFGQLDFQLRSTTQLTTGLRIEQHQADFNNSQQEKFNPSETLWGANLTLSEKLNQHHMAYGTLARGFKAGGFNTGLAGNPPASLLQFSSETATNYEIGLKSNWPAQNLKTKISAFYTDRQNPQFDGYDQVNYFRFYTENLSSAKNYGLEGEFNWQPQPRWQLFGSLGLITTEVNGTPQNASMIGLPGRAQSHAPGYQAMLGTQYRTVNGYFARIDANAVDSFYFDNVHNFKSNAYTLWNARIGYQAKEWEVFLWGRNITDEKYATRGFFFANNPDTYPQNEGYIRLGDRQQFGLTTRFYF